MFTRCSFHSRTVSYLQYTIVLSMAAVGSILYPQKDGHVRYYLALRNGARLVPANTLTFSTSAVSQITISNPQCTLDSNGSTATVGPGIAQGSPQLAPHANLTCSVDALVTSTHAQLGHVPAFDITAEYGLTGESAEVFHIPPVSTGSSVLVHTGGKLEYVKTEVLTAQSSTYYTSASYAETSRSLLLRHDHMRRFAASVIADLSVLLSPKDIPAGSASALLQMCFSMCGVLYWQITSVSVFDGG